MDPHTLHLGHQLPSLTGVLRSLKRQESSLYNCVASCLDDAEFVKQIAMMYPSLPVFVNLRCGLWYVEHPTSSCYFKSTDGHSGNWSFSTTRLNLHMAGAAAAHHGCIVVDATRRGKTFPDAMTKTVPIWAAVLNRAVKRLREPPGGSTSSTSSSTTRGGSNGGSASGSAQECGVCSGSANRGYSGEKVQAWQQAWEEAEDVHLPPWISDNEKHQIQMRLEGWVDQLLEVRADLSPLLRTLHKPLRCMWVSQESRIWTDQVADTTQLCFTPLVLVSASLPNARERRQLTLGAQGVECEPLHVMFDYVPGAGDDEESWALGLTPALMWLHKRELLGAGMDGIEAVVRRLLAGQHGQHAAAATAVEEATPPQEGQQELPQGRPGQLVAAPHVKAKWRSVREVPTDGVHLAPEGCRLAADSTATAGTGSGIGCQITSRSSGDSSGVVVPGLDGAGGAAPVGMRFLGETGLAVGPVGSGELPAVWDHVDAVLNVGLWEHPGMAAEREQEREQGKGEGERSLAADGSTPTAEGAAAAAESTTVAGAAGVRDAAGNASAAAGAAETTAAAPGAGCAAVQRGRLPRYMWLPVPNSKFDRHGLRSALPAALEFVSGHLWAGRRVLIHCDNGLDTSICTALAVLLACFRLPQQQQGQQDTHQEKRRMGSSGAEVGLCGGATGEGTEVLSPAASGAPAVVAAAGTCRASPLLVQPYTLDPATQTPLPAAASEFSKLAVRRHLAMLMGYCPQARPTRGMLKQVYNLFVPGPAVDV